MVQAAFAVAGTDVWGVGHCGRAKGAGMVQTAFAVAATVLWGLGLGHWGRGKRSRDGANCFCSRWHCDVGRGVLGEGMVQSASAGAGTVLWGEAVGKEEGGGVGETRNRDVAYIYLAVCTEAECRCRAGSCISHSCNSVHSRVMLTSLPYAVLCSAVP